MRNLKMWLSSLVMILVLPATSLAINTNPKAPPVLGPIGQNWVQWAVWIFIVIALIFVGIGLLKWISAIGNGRSSGQAIAMIVAAIVAIIILSDLQGWTTRLSQLFRP